MSEQACGGEAGVLGGDQQCITFSSAEEWVWPSVTCGFIIQDSGGASH